MLLNKSSYHIWSFSNISKRLQGALVQGNIILWILCVLRIEIICLHMLVQRWLIGLCEQILILKAKISFTLVLLLLSRCFYRVINCRIQILLLHVTDISFFLELLGILLGLLVSVHKAVDNALLHYFWHSWLACKVAPWDVWYALGVKLREVWEDVTSEGFWVKGFPALFEKALKGLVLILLLLFLGLTA